MLLPAAVNPLYMCKFFCKGLTHTFRGLNMGMTGVL